jgi:lysyl-tRNA synthetase class 2
MQSSAGGAIAKPFLTHHNALNIGLYLRIAPELYLKKLLIGGMKKIFEIGKNFRNEGISTKHNPEFTSMEAYEAFGNYETMMALVQNIIVTQVQNIHGRLTDIPYGDHLLNFTPPFKRVTLQELVVGDGTPEYRHRVYEDEIEQTIIQPTFVLNMPISAVPLAKPCDQNSWNKGYSEVFELVIGGMEIAPGYTELNDPDIQLQNFQTKGHVMDQDFVDALKVGMPPAGGMGLGIDRLVAILTNQPSIRDVIPFPVLRPI